MDGKNKFPKIFSEQFQHDMGSWLSEKSESALLSLVLLKKTILCIEDKLDSSIANTLNNDIFSAMTQVTKIFSFSLGSDYNAGDENLLYEKLDDGFDELRVKYGLLDKTNKQIETEKYGEFLSKINEYISMEQYPGRTFLQELLEKYSFYINEHSIIGHYLIKIERELYKVANGEKEWAEFISETKSTLSLVSKYNVYDLFEIKKDRNTTLHCILPKSFLNNFNEE